MREDKRKLKKSEILRLIHATNGRVPVSELSVEEIDFIKYKIFGVGLGKTGTTSLAHAMYELGFKTSHGIKSIDSIGGNQFCNDISVACRYKFLDYIFPAAKFILTVRDEDSWVKSCKRWGAGRRGLVFNKFGLPALPLSRAEYRFLTFGTCQFEEEQYRKIHREFDKGVIEHFKGREDKLLIMNILEGDGWDVLCPFVDKPIPDDPFPSVKP